MVEKRPLGMEQALKTSNRESSALRAHPAKTLSYAPLKIHFHFLKMECWFAEILKLNFYKQACLPGKMPKISDIKHSQSQRSKEYFFVERNMKYISNGRAGPVKNIQDFFLYCAICLG